MNKKAIPYVTANKLNFTHLKMIQKFQENIIQNFPFLIKSRFFLAVSGGLDSMVMLDLFHKLGYQFAILHCNFMLRGKESDGDMKFVIDYGDKHLIPWSVGHFETKAYAKEMKVSIQVAARELRYDWFFEQIEEKDFDYVLTAHHADDSLETFLINLSRGSGLEGLTGIPEINEIILRPMLIFSREEIERYSKENNIKWREDSSNASDKYLRNKIRHDIVPVLKELDPNFINAFHKSQTYLKETQTLVNDAVAIRFNQVAKHTGNDIYFDLNILKLYKNYKSYLYYWLKDYHFSDWPAVYELVESQSGKKVFSPEYRLVKNRDFLILTPINLDFEYEEESFLIKKNQKELTFPIKISICKVKDTSIISLSAIFVDEAKLKFPLVLRKWNNGDVFYPSGMNGKSKKVSKFFKDEKYSLIEKENAWLLCSDDQVVWIVGQRQDERFRINELTKNILQIKLNTTL